MPLEHSASPAAFKRNVSTLMGEIGQSPHVQSRKQALAISYATQRRAAQGKKSGGGVAGYQMGGAPGAGMGAGMAARMIGPGAGMPMRPPMRPGMPPHPMSMMVGPGGQPAGRPPGGGLNMPGNRRGGAVRGYQDGGSPTPPWWQNSAGPSGPGGPGVTKPWWEGGDPNPPSAPKPPARHQGVTPKPPVHHPAATPQPDHPHNPPQPGSPGASDGSGGTGGTTTNRPRNWYGQPGGDPGGGATAPPPDMRGQPGGPRKMPNQPATNWIGGNPNVTAGWVNGQWQGQGPAPPLAPGAVMDKWGNVTFPNGMPGWTGGGWGWQGGAPTPGYGVSGAGVPPGGTTSPWTGGGPGGKGGMPGQSAPGIGSMPMQPAGGGAVSPGVSATPMPAQQAPTATPVATNPAVSRQGGGPIGNPAEGAPDPDIGMAMGLPIPPMGLTPGPGPPQGSPMPGKMGRAWGGPINVAKAPNLMGPSPLQRFEGRQMMHGPVLGSLPGRSDARNTQVPSGSYILPAHHVASMGDGNSMAGLRAANNMFGPNGPYGAGMPKVVHGAGPPKPSMPKMPRMAGVGAAPKVPKIAIPGGGSFGGGSNSGNGGGPGPSGVSSEGGARMRPDHMMGMIGRPVRVALSDGEFAILPQVVRNLSLMHGGGGSLKNGHRLLDAYVMHARKKEIEKLKNLPAPAKRMDGGRITLGRIAA